MLALIHATEIISQWPEGGWFELPDGTRASPAVSGWSQGGYSLATVQDADPVPEDKVSTGQTVQMVAGAPKWVHTLADAPVPQSVSRAQGKTVLIQQGLWSQVVAFVDAIEDPTAKALAEVALNDTTEWRRDSPFLAQAAQSLELSDAQMDDLFTAAAQVAL